MRSGVGWLVVSSAITAMALWSAASCDWLRPPQSPPGQGQDADVDGGDGFDAGRDGGDGGDGGSDAGADGGSDGGRAAIVIPGGEGWTFYGPESGAPVEVWGVSSDAAGNLWVAGGPEGLFLLREGASRSNTSPSRTG